MIMEELKDCFNELDIYNKRKILLDEILDTCMVIEKICSKKKIDINRLKSNYVLKNRSTLSEKDFLELNYIYLLYLKEDLGLLLKDL